MYEDIYESIRLAVEKRNLRDSTANTYYNNSQADVLYVYVKTDIIIQLLEDILRIDKMIILVRNAKNVVNQ